MPLKLLPAPAVVPVIVTGTALPRSVCGHTGVGVAVPVGVGVSAIAAGEDHHGRPQDHSEHANTYRADCHGIANIAGGSPLWALKIGDHPFAVRLQPARTSSAAIGNTSPRKVSRWQPMAHLLNGTNHSLSLSKAYLSSKVRGWCRHGSG
jgi:hypothetical protein